MEDASDDSLLCGKTVTTPLPPSQAPPPAESAMFLEPKLELYHSGNESEATATTTTCDSDASPEPCPVQSVPPITEDQVNCKMETKKEGDQKEEEQCQKPRWRPWRILVHVNRAAWLLQEEEKRKWKEEKKEDNEKQDEDTDGKEEGQLEKGEEQEEEVREKEEKEELHKEEEKEDEAEWEAKVEQAMDSLSITLPAHNSCIHKPRQMDYSQSPKG